MKLIAMLSALVLLTGCQTAYYSTMEKLGIEKRDILVDRVDEAKDAQGEAQEEFRSALERLDSMLNIEGGELEERYDALKSDYEASQNAAERVRDRIEAVDGVAQDLFDEWSEELEQYSNNSMRRQSEQQLRETERRYADLIRTMERAASKMDPVLAKLQDNVLYLKHNLNARAITAIRGEFDALQMDIKQLIEEMETAIAESDKFIESMQ